MRSNDELVDYLVKRRLLSTDAVVDAFRKVDRSVFSPMRPYVDSPQPIGQGQTVSAPHMVAIMTEALGLEPGMTVLEVGGGCGYQAAILGVLASPSVVHTIEYVPELARMARGNLAEAGVGNVVVHHGDGSVGLPGEAPFDRIIVTCAAPGIPPPLKEQTADGGALLIPVGRGFQDLTRVVRNGSGFEVEDLGGCVFVPLRGKHGF